ncbi:orotate phosphoribosyltransferase [soil metagenome]
MDCRRIIAFPSLRRRLVATGLARLREAGALTDVKGVVGGESSGIALAAWIADSLELPLHYVRKKAAGQSQVEGALTAGEKVLLVDDMVAAGNSKVRFIRALHAEAAKVSDVFVVFDYGTFGNDELLRPFGVTLHALADWNDVLAVARELPEGGGGVSAAGLDELQEFVADPSAWSLNHGGFGRQPADEPT